MPNQLTSRPSHFFARMLTQALLVVLAAFCTGAGAASLPVRVGLDAKFGLDNSTSALGARELLIARYRTDGVLVPTGE